MSPEDYIEAKQHLLSAVNLIALDGVDQKNAVDMVARMEMNDKPTDEILLAIVSYLRDLLTQ